MSHIEELNVEESTLLLPSSQKTDWQAKMFSLYTTFARTDVLNAVFRITFWTTHTCNPWPFWVTFVLFLTMVVYTC